MPGTAEEYIHRIGRTGRAGAKGTSYSFFTATNARLAKRLVAVLTEAGQQVPAELLAFAAAAESLGPTGTPSPNSSPKWGPFRNFWGC